jgi:hypothetical protein
VSCAGEHGGGDVLSESNRCMSHHSQERRQRLYREHPALGRVMHSRTGCSPRPRLGWAAQHAVTLTTGVLALICFGFVLAGAPMTGSGFLAALVSVASHRASRRHSSPRTVGIAAPAWRGRGRSSPLTARSTG